VKDSRFSSSKKSGGHGEEGRGKIVKTYKPPCYPNSRPGEGGNEVIVRERPRVKKTKEKSYLARRTPAIEHPRGRLQIPFYEGR